MGKIGPTAEELEKLRKYIDKEVTITVHVCEIEYTETHNEYDYSYKMRVINVIDTPANCIVGAFSEKGPWRRKGDTESQLFEFVGPDISREWGEV